MNAPPLEQVWEVLEQVKDPEIPVVSVVELGLIRQVGYEKGHLVVTLSPSFAGCPALDVMAADIEARLTGLGIGRVAVKTVYRPPWTSDWITSTGREKLKGCGLAPPAIHAGDLERALAEAARCPYCDSTDTELKNSFGPTLCRAIYVCLACRQPFEQFKPL
ncbi:MAG: 1,2-phenylacetyl-CoA epoxidase subunit PaaD [Nitrospiraceae bacterium]